MLPALRHHVYSIFNSHVSFYTSMASKRKISSKEEVSPKKSKSVDTISTSTSVPSTTGGLRISSWNVNGMRAFVKKGGLAYVTRESPDIMLFQETKCGLKDLPKEVENLAGYHSYFQETANRNGYAGVGMVSKIAPKNITFGMGITDHDNEGRLITAEFDKFYLINAYVPNSGRGLVRLKYRQKWDENFKAYIQKLDKIKPIIYCGDLNVSHQEIDLANPKTNANKTAGFTDQERNDFSELLNAGFIDTFRHFNPKQTGAYTFWSTMHNARASNTGWRLDYFVVSARLIEQVRASEIQSTIMGSDHCPIILTVDI